jgi:hypothetical protein
VLLAIVPIVGLLQSSRSNPPRTARKNVNTMTQFSRSARCSVTGNSNMMA